MTTERWIRESSSLAHQQIDFQPCIQPPLDTGIMTSRSCVTGFAGTAATGQEREHMATVNRLGSIVSSPIRCLAGQSIHWHTCTFSTFGPFRLGCGLADGGMTGKRGDADSLTPTWARCDLCLQLCTSIVDVSPAYAAGQRGMWHACF